MANVKITELTAATALAGTDVLPIVDVGADATKKVSVSDLLRNLPDGTAAAPALAFADDQNTGVLSPGNNSLAFATSGTQRLVIDSSGDLAIGNTSADGRLHVRKDGTGQILQLWQSDLGTNNRNIQLKSPSSDSATEPFTFSTGNSFAVQIDSSEAFRIDSSGRVGVGTSSPDKLLHLAGADTAIIRLENTDTSLTANQIIGGLEFEKTDGSGAGAGVVGGLRMYSEGSIGESAYLTLSTASSSTNNVEALRINSSGQVGIGTSSPTGYIHIEGASTGTETYGRFTTGPANGDQSLVIKSGSSRDHMAIQVSTNAGANDDLSLQPDGGNVGIGTTSPGEDLEVYNTTGPSIKLNDGGDYQAYFTLLGNDLEIRSSSGSLEFYTGSADGASSTERMRISNSGQVIITDASNAYLNLTKTGAGNGSFQFDGSTFDITSNSSSASLTFGTASTERMRLTSGSVAGLHLGKTGFNVNEVGVSIGVAGTVEGLVECTRSGAECLKVGRNTNDGKIVEIRQGASEEGNISVSGTTVSYNGGHLARWSQLAGGAERTEILRGSVLSNLDEMCEWGEEENEQLNRMKVSEVEGDPNVSGVFQAWDDDDDTYTNDFYCAMTGDFVIRIAQGTTVARGDLLMSAGDGTAKSQDDDIVRSKTIAKVTSTTVSTTYPDGSYCVPCVLMAC